MGSSFCLTILQMRVMSNFRFCAILPLVKICRCVLFLLIVDVLHNLQPELGDAKKVGFEKTIYFFAVVGPLASFCSPAKGWRQHQPLKGAFRFLLSRTVC